MIRRIVLLAAVSACAALCGEQAVLSTGFRLRIERHEQIGNTLRLYTSAEGFVDVPAEHVVAFEAEEYVPLPPKPPPETVAPAPQLPAGPPTPKQLVTDSAKKYGLPPAFVESVARAESAFRPDAISRKGAIGIMQLMPGTAAAYKADPHDPAQNVEAGTRYLTDLLLKYQDYDDQVARALAAYNAGPGAVDRYNGIPPYRETQTYVRRVLDHYQRTKSKPQ
jgi:soluble lytic murein transglycosylase-like protein